MARVSLVSESEILAEVIAADRGDLPVEAAQSILNWKFTTAAVRRMNSLAERNRRGEITDSEREQLQRYLRVGSLINLLQAKARLSLKAVDSE